MSEILLNDAFPRSNRYNPEWIMESPMGAHPLWLTEWLAGHLDLQPDMRVLDLGCGKAKSSIFLAREYGLEVWAVDLWTGADENLLRIEDAGVSDRVIPIHADARQLPFAGEFFDLVICIDAFNYFGTDDLYLNYLAHFVREDGILAFVSAGLMQDFGGSVPAHLKQLWTGDYWTLHTAAWWRDHVGKTGLFEVVHAGDMPDGWQLWVEWAAATDAASWYRDTLKADRGRYLGYVGLVGRRVPGVQLAEHAWPSTLSSWESRYVPCTLLRLEADARPQIGTGLGNCLRATVGRLRRR
jgi:SAM-dependent methyltransferase